MRYLAACCHLCRLQRTFSYAFLPRTSRGARALARLKGTRSLPSAVAPRVLHTFIIAIAPRCAAPAPEGEADGISGAAIAALHLLFALTTSCSRGCWRMLGVKMEKR